MIRSLYTGASGMLAKWTEVDVISNNLANVNTPGFKKHEVLFKEEPRFQMHRLFDAIIETPRGELDNRPYIGDMGTGVRVKGEWVDFAQGAVKATGNPLDLAIWGDGFFEVERDGRKFYTRAGNFTLNGNGELVTLNGDRVIGADGAPVVVGAAQMLKVQDNGLLVDQTGAALGQISLVTFENMQQLSKVGDNLFMETRGSGPSSPAPRETVIRQGYLETANADVVKEMVRLIVANRAYEANQRVITTADASLQQTFDVGRV